MLDEFMTGIEESLPISVVGTGGNLNLATDNALERAAAVLDSTVPEIKNRATITGPDTSVKMIYPRVMSHIMRIYFEFTLSSPVPAYIYSYFLILYLLQVWIY